MLMKGMLTVLTIGTAIVLPAEATGPRLMQTMHEADVKSS
jgi:hypothetical protein